MDEQHRRNHKKDREQKDKDRGLKRIFSHEVLLRHDLDSEFPVCLAAESAAQTTQPSVQPAVYDGDQSVQKVIDDLNSEITALEAQVNARRFPWVEYLTVSIASILLTLAGVWMFVKMRIQKILWKRKVGYDQIGPSGQRDPSRVRDDPGYDDPYPPGT